MHPAWTVDGWQKMENERKREVMCCVDGRPIMLLLAVERAFE